MQILLRHGQSFSSIPVSPRPRHLADEVCASEVPEWMSRCHFACDDVNSPIAFLPSVIRTLFISLWILLCPFTFCRGSVMAYTLIDNVDKHSLASLIVDIVTYENDYFMRNESQKNNSEAAF